MPDAATPVTRRGTYGAAYVTGEGVILVDDKFEQDHDAIVAQVKSVTPLPVKYVLSTHHHSDHTGGTLPELVKRDVPEIAVKTTSPALYAVPAVMLPALIARAFTRAAVTMAAAGDGWSPWILQAKPRPRAIPR